MVEVQLLNYVINKGDISLLVHNNITPDKFSSHYVNECVFVFNHYRTYGKVPDMATMLDNFNDFPVIEVKENDNYLVKKFREDYVYRMQIEAAKEWGQALSDPDSETAFQVIKEKIDSITKIDIGTSVGIDITQDISRLDRYKEALKNPRVTGIPTGIEQLDSIIHGILPNDLTVLAARTNQGKSFLGLEIAKNIWKQKKRVLFYSGENSVLNTGYRFDTLHGNFSNSALMFGKPDLGQGTNGEEYEKHIKKLKDFDVPFIVVTPKELMGQRLGINKIYSLYEVYKPDIIFLDQLSLMTDDRGKYNTSERFRYSHIMEDLRLFVEAMSVPVVIMSQTSRNNTQNDEGILEPARIEHLSESDGVGQNATKILTFAVNKGVLHLVVRKNTNGEKERGFKMVWDIDTGVFSKFTSPEEPSGFAVKEEDDNRGSGKEVF